LIAAQRAAGEAFCGTPKEQLKPSAARPVLPAAKAALVAVMQTTNNAAAAISIISLMRILHSSILMHFLSGESAARSLEKAISHREISAFKVDPTTKIGRKDAPKSARSLHKIIPAQCTTIVSTVSIAVQRAYHLRQSNCQDLNLARTILPRELSVARSTR
jgi:hypothetical protein